MSIGNIRRIYNEKCIQLADSKWMSAHAFQYVCAFSGIPCSLLFLLGFVAADFVGPVRPWWTAEQTAHHYQTHKTGVRAGAALIVLSGLFYMPFSACVSSQMRRIPRLHYIVQQLQLGAAAAGVFTFILPGIILATTSYRPWRSVEATQTLNDFFWICTLMPWPTFMVQSYCLSYAILIDKRPKSLFPRELALYNLIIPCLWTPAVGIHCTKYGSVAYDGALTFWVLGISFCTQLFVESIFLILAIRSEPEGGEKIVDMFPNRIPKDLEAPSGDLNGNN